MGRVSLCVDVKITLVTEESGRSRVDVLANRVHSMVKGLGGDHAPKLQVEDVEGIRDSPDIGIRGGFVLGVHPRCRPRVEVLVSGLLDGGISVGLLPFCWEEAMLYI